MLKITGSKVKIYKQDPSVKPIGVRSSYIHTNVQDGPKDNAIEINGTTFVRGDQNNDFIFDPENNPKEFDAVHTFTVIRQVSTMYTRVLRNMEKAVDFEWQWGNQPIKVYPHAGKEKNAYYSRHEQVLKFFYFHPHDNTNEPLVYTCRSFDVVAHETGHAILDALRPGYWNSWNAQTGGLHESFGDLTAIFTMLAQMDQCEAIIAESKADLHAKELFFSAVAEQFGEALYGKKTGLRNADNDLKLSEVSNQVHSISQVFTGAIYDILADIFKDYHNPDYFDPAESLFRVGKHMTYLLMLSILNGPSYNATYQDIAEKMIENEPRNEWKKIIRDQFTVREVLAPPTRFALDVPQELNWETCCSTLRQEEHLKLVEEAIRTEIVNRKQ